jgi:hypothetical protein
MRTATIKRNPEPFSGPTLLSEVAGERAGIRYLRSPRSARRRCSFPNGPGKGHESPR